ncbi:MAG: response regulator [Spirochaetota bacterium]
MIRVMFVDDDQNLIFGLRRSLRHMNDRWDMVFHTAPGEALLQFADNPADIVVTDYKMPSINGIELLMRIRQLSPETRIIILTGQSQQDVYNSAKEYADGYLAKPCSQEELVSAVSRLHPA